MHSYEFITVMNFDCQTSELICSGFDVFCLSYQHEQMERVFEILYSFISYVL